MENSLIRQLPSDIRARFVVIKACMQGKYPTAVEATLDRLAYKYLHAEVLADWYQWQIDHRNWFNK